ncbi:uncharacterized protein LOC143021765 [Oratosquilla oratoria]|uniref:uncharacterized protein LOC143021765 n=1 Tax=Oratosquilla oratoria TaxID=337810 RepID=UPI003F765F08
MAERDNIENEDDFTLIQRRRLKERLNPSCGPCDTPRVAAVAPRAKYKRLSFPYDMTHVERLDWIHQLTVTHAKERFSIFKPNVTSPFVYVERIQENFIRQLLRGSVRNIVFKDADTPNFFKKYKEYIVTNYPKDLPLDKVKELDGVQEARRHKEQGKTLDSVIIKWKGLFKPPIEYLFNGTDGDTSEIKEWNPPFFCDKCHEEGHVAKYCINPDPYSKPEDITFEDFLWGATKVPSTRTSSNDFGQNCSKCGQQDSSVWHRDCPNVPKDIQPSCEWPPLPKPGSLVYKEGGKKSKKRKESRWRAKVKEEDLLRGLSDLFVM